MRSFLKGRNRQYQRGMFAPPPSDTVHARVLAANTAELVAVPAGAMFVVFSATADFYVKFGASEVAAAVPGGDVTDGTASELNPSAREIPDGATHLSLVSAAACTVTLSFYGE